MSHLTVSVLLLLFTCSSVEGQFQVIGSLQPILAAPGDEVVLPCRVEPPMDVGGLTVEWTKPDRPPDPNDELSKYRYVHLYRDTREVLDMKISSYEMRTALFIEDLRQGNASLKITNVTLEDNGRYKCHLPKLQGQTRFSFLHLVVDANFTKLSTTETPLRSQTPQTPDPLEELDSEGKVFLRSRLALPVCLLLLTVVGAGAFCITVICKRAKANPL
ncbi:hypothetical protein INR49_019790 [Caranx melampygus]|nr:hypothetical protein INR49_019790 [Caranx melampygus]